MDKDWNLRKHDKCTCDYSRLQKPIIYDIEDMKHLRDTLIDDVKDHYWDSLYEDKDLIIKHITYIINRRFGIDEV